MPAREVHAAERLPDAGVQAAVHAVQRRAEPARFHRVRQLGRVLGLAEGHVVTQRPLEAGKVLKHRRHLPPPRVHVQVAQVGLLARAANQNPAFRGVVKAQQQLDQRGLPRPVFPHDGDGLSLGNGEREVLDDRRLAAVAERHVLQGQRQLTRQRAGVGGQRDAGGGVEKAVKLGEPVEVLGAGAQVF